MAAGAEEVAEQEVAEEVRMRIREKGEDAMGEAEEMAAGETEATEQEQQEVAEEAKVRIRGNGGCGRCSRGGT